MCPKHFLLTSPLPCYCVYSPRYWPGSCGSSSDETCTPQDSSIGGDTAILSCPTAASLETEMNHASHATSAVVNILSKVSKKKSLTLLQCIAMVLVPSLSWCHKSEKYDKYSQEVFHILTLLTHASLWRIKNDWTVWGSIQNTEKFSSTLFYMNYT